MDHYYEVTRALAQASTKKLWRNELLCSDNHNISDLSERMILNVWNAKWNITDIK